MPIVDIEFVGRPTTDAQEMADALGAVFGSEPGTTWVRIRDLGETRYAENHSAPLGVRPVFVTVLLRVIPDPIALVALTEALAGVVADLTRRPSENVHIEFAPPGAGRIAFGGRLIE